SRAIAEQWEIVRSVDPRPLPPATATLWLEGSRLMSQGNLSFPEGVIIVFADDGPSQTMQEDFETATRRSGGRYGVYYHVGFWGTGPHLLQGSRPDRIRRELGKVVAKGDTAYAIVNVCNVREHVLGIQAATEMMGDYASWSEAGFWSRFAPPVLHGQYQEFLGCLFPTGDDRILQDGALVAAARRLLTGYTEGRRDPAALATDPLAERRRQLRGAIERLEGLISRYPTDKLTGGERRFYDTHLLGQAKMWRQLDVFYLALIEAHNDPGRLSDAEAALEGLLEMRGAAATGKWENWYRGDKKVNVPDLLEKTRAARKRLQSS
ncbi:MAG: glycosyl hydrolase 115 family protein, partial [Thermoguttaceae bacterium]